MNLSVNDLTKAYRAGAAILRGVTFQVAAGESVAVVGVSGAGKSTLLHLIGGLEAADGGTITLGDFVVTRANAAALNRWRNEHVGFVFQFHHLLPDLTAGENVALPLLIKRASLGDARERARLALGDVGLCELDDRPVTELSGGEQQRVAVARALVTRPRLVLADEPTGNLDGAAALACGELLVALAREGRAACVLATHNERVAALCDRVLLLERGRVREVGGV